MKSDFEAIYGEYKDKVYTIARRTLTNSQDALDVAQDVFVRLYEKAGKLPPAGELGAYIYRMTVNRCIDLLRKIRPFKGPANLETMPAPDANPADSSDEVGFLLSGLNPDQKTAVILKEIIGLQLSEIAGICAIDEGTVKSRLFRAKEIMRETHARRSSK